MASYDGPASQGATMTQLTLYAPPDAQHSQLTRGPGGTAPMRVQGIVDPDEQAEGPIAAQQERAHWSDGGSGGSSRGGRRGDSSSGSGKGSASTTSASTSGGCGCPYADKDKKSSRSHGSSNRSRDMIGSASTTSAFTSGGCGCPCAEKDKKSGSSSGGGGRIGSGKGRREGEGEESGEEEQRSVEYEVRTAEPSQLYLYMPPTEQASHVAEVNMSRRQQGRQEGASGRRGSAAGAARL